MAICLLCSSAWACALLTWPKSLVWCSTELALPLCTTPLDATGEKVWLHTVCTALVNRNRHCIVFEEMKILCYTLIGVYWRHILFLTDRQCQHFGLIFLKRHSCVNYVINYVIKIREAFNPYKSHWFFIW